MTNRSAEELAQSAAGNIKEKNLTSTGGVLSNFLYDGPIIDYINKNEQPHYIFKNTGKGFRITNPSDDEKTPHHNISGRCYLVITDSRILYLAGVGGEDESIIIPYEKVKKADSDINASFNYILINTKYGTEYKFNPWRANSDTIELATRYINDKTNDSKEAGNTEPVQVKNVSNLDKAESDDNSSDNDSSKTSSVREPDLTTRGKEVRISGNTNEKTNCGKIKVYYDRIEVESKGTILSKGWITIKFDDVNNMSLSTLGKLQIMTMSNDYRISGLGGQSGGKIKNLYNFYPARAAIRNNLSNSRLSKEEEIEVLSKYAEQEGFSDDLIQHFEDIIL
jgi:hypothetical protein